MNKVITRKFVEKHVVRYYESERGWGSDTWETAYDSYEEAMKWVNETNEKFMGKDFAPDYYIRATYVGLKEVEI